MWGPDLEYVDEWTLPLLPDSGMGAPTQMVDACVAVGSDLHWRRSGAHLDLDRLRWTLSLHETGVAVWCDPRTDRAVAPIGLLAAREDD
ncbi:MULTISPECIES: hypothetical protein [unclassified Rhodococcus (in: high G+C Gram-positive bacteria)]|uniref:hypothetical protein n=1 Tax=unclassified Rhodococcus (in: high G+C Gram-positive bacteria) TaxID=192944 RepID=UPI0006FFD194|nr:MULTISPECIES: hypothetical protein [unclassified Rhodococcus (in: high G+C Gram-positive bacteria)]KQU28303.1 hypothetical protein ASG69_09760 [Rhodococcus sp. Leaf225]KQU46411.1 hypothetical protein ASH03_06795 [Rhodococcus sp. Leaf258]